MENKSFRNSTFKFNERKNGLIRIALLISCFAISLLICNCSKIVDIGVPPDDEGGISDQGTCVACHSAEEMIAFVADDIPPPAEGGEG